MDLLRPRAIPALIAALATAMHAGAACDALNGTYRFDGGVVENRARHLSDLTPGPAGGKLARVEGGTRKFDLGGSQPINRGKVTYLAVTGTVAANARGATIDYRDAQGTSLATIGIGAGWTCRGDALERAQERTAGLGDNIRTERVQERLEKVGGDLVHTENVTVIEPAGGKPKRAQVRFRAAK